MKSRIWSLVALGLTVLSTTAQAKEELIQVSGRPEAVTRVLVTYDPEAAPGLVALLLAGGDGDYDFAQGEAGIAMRNEARLPNRLRPLLLERGVASFMVDRPVGSAGMDDGFRASSHHMTDLKAVLKAIQARFPAAPIVVVGHSNGTLSATYLSAEAPESVGGTVLINGRFVAHPWLGDGLSRYHWEKISTPLLLIHHKKDDCFGTPYSGAADLAELYKRFELITVNPEGGRAMGSCSYDGTHNMVGQEAAVADAIAGWTRRKADQP